MNAILTKSVAAKLEAAQQLSGKTSSGVLSAALDSYLEELEDINAVKAYKASKKKLTPFSEIRKKHGL